MKALGVGRVAAVLALCAVAVVAAHGQTFQTLAKFNIADGNRPPAGVILGSDGNFYGTTWYGGVVSTYCAAEGASTEGCGTVFQITPSGTLTTLYSFCQLASCGDGWQPIAGLVQGRGGNFYGTTSIGGMHGSLYNGGTVFRITPSGEFTTIHSFCALTNCADGDTPRGSLMQANDGNLYGTTVYGGTSSNCSQGCGTVFKVSPDGVLTTLYSFCSLGNCPDGEYPNGSLMQGSDGNLYGTGNRGDGSGDSIIFRITPSGAETIVYTFGPDSGGVNTPLVQDANGNLYGTTNSGGARHDGTAFEVTSTGTLINLYSFCAQPKCADGAGPAGGMIFGGDGNLYGVSGSGGTKYGGSIYQLTPSGTLTTLDNFCSSLRCTDGKLPQGLWYRGVTASYMGLRRMEASRTVLVQAMGQCSVWPWEWLRLPR